MNANPLLGATRALLLGAACAWAAQAHAIDSFDGSHLSVPMVDVNGTVYTNVVTSVGGIVSVESGTPRGNFDSYDIGTGRLFIPAVVFGSSTFTNVTVSVTLANVTHVGGTMGAAPSFLLVSNSNDRTISSYLYGVRTTSPSAGPVSVVGDPALANLRAGKQPKLFLDKANSLVFNAVPMGNGQATLTTFSINLATGGLTAIAGASVTLAGSEGTVDTFNHQVISVGNSGVTLYPYDPATGMVQAAVASSSDPVFQNAMTYDPQDNLLFGTDGAKLSTYGFPAGTVQPVLIAQTSSTIESSANANDVSGRFDLARKLMFVTDTSTSTSATLLSTVPFTASTVGPVGAPVVTTNSWFCGIDPTSRLLFISPTTGSNLNVFSYGAGGAINASPTQFSPLVPGGNYAGCADVDPVNRIAFFSSNGNSTAVSYYYVYDTTSGALTMTSAPAGSITLTGGSGQFDILSTQSLHKN